MSTTTITLKEQALELQEFFLGSYEEHTLQAAIDSGDDTLLVLAVEEANNHKALAEEYENDHSN